jgi:FtsZ-binding cell division protein ZapB
VIDIVDRLRSVRAAKPFEILEHTAQEAADTIELLRAELQNAYDLTKTLTAERDEARRMICRLHFTSAELQHDFAKAKGWDCFKQEDGK